MNVTDSWISFSTQSNESKDCYPPAHPERKIFVALHLTVILIGIPSNIFFLFVSYRLIRQKNELGVYLFNLALSDLLFITCLPVWIEFALNDQWLHGKAACTVCVFLLFTYFYTSIVLLSCIAVDRYLAIVHPLKFSTFRKRRIALSLSVAAWIFALVFNAITVDLNGVYDEENKVCLDVYLSHKQKWANVTRFVVGFLIPALVVGFCYWRICSDIKNNQTLRSMELQHVFKLLVCVLLTLYLCFGPVHIMMVLKVLLESCPHPSWLFFAYKTSVFLATLNCLADPLLYGFTSRTGKDSASGMLLILRRAWRKETQTETVQHNEHINGTAMLSNDKSPI